MSLVNAFDNYRFWGGKRNTFLQKIKFYGIANRLLDLIANNVLPIYFRLTANNPNYSLSQDNVKGEKIVVSLTSYPVRIPQLWKVIECLLRQSVKPDKIILYLTKKQIGKIDNLPDSLLKLQKRGLEIKLCEEEIRSHTKYFYAFQQYPNDIVITVDDDLFYRTDLIESHLKWHKKYPNNIIVNWAKEILPTTSLYKEWPDVQTPKCSNRFLLLGVSSVLYPPKSMYEDVFNVDMIKELCLTADDVWLSCMALLAHTQICFTGYQYHHLPVLIKNNTTLLDTNRERNQICVDNLNNYYYQKIGMKPFADLPE